nr:histidine kinase [Vibrio cyclitrophicus]
MIQYVASTVQDIDTTKLIHHVSLFIITMAVTFWILTWLCHRKIFKGSTHNIFHYISINLVLGITAIHVSLSIVEPLPIEKAIPRLEVISYVNILLQVTIYTVVVHHLRFKQHSIELEMLLKRSELTMLRMQTNPHFLFNTLNLISKEIPEKTELAQELIYDLSDLLRGTISLCNHKRIKIHEEIELVTHYLHIQKARFGKRLETELLIDSKAQDLYVPPMLILPLVENVVKHAVNMTCHPVTLKLHSFSLNDRLTIRVSNSWPENTVPTFQIGGGLQNIIDTLNLEYDEAYLDVGYFEEESYAMITIKCN